MKLKAFALSVALVAGIFSANAQTAKCGKDVFLGIGAGISSVMTPGFNSPSVYGNIMVGKYITPTVGVRAVIGGPFQSVDPENLTYNKSFPTDWNKNKLFGELNGDFMFNFSNIGRDDLAAVDFYIFAGPTLNLSSAGSKFNGSSFAGGLFVDEDTSLKLRVGATAGLGLGFNITEGFALALEGRYSVTPSIWGDAAHTTDYAFNKAQGVTRVTLNGIWTLGGNRSKAERLACAAKAAGYLSAAEAAAAIAKALDENPKIVEKVVEKEVIKEVDKVVYENVPASTAVFFPINVTTLTAADKARIKLFADDIKAGSSDQVYTVTGYADKATGSVKTNQRLSEKRAQSVYDALIAEGVPAKQLEKAAEGGVGPMFFNNIALSRTTIVAPKTK